MKKAILALSFLQMAFLLNAMERAQPDEKPKTKKDLVVYANAIKAVAQRFGCNENEVSLNDEILGISKNGKPYEILCGVCRSQSFITQIDDCKEVVKAFGTIQYAPMPGYEEYVKQARYQRTEGVLKLPTICLAALHAFNPAITIGKDPNKRQTQFIATEKWTDTKEPNRAFKHTHYYTFDFDGTEEAYYENYGYDL